MNNKEKLKRLIQLANKDGIEDILADSIQLGQIWICIDNLNNKKLADKISKSFEEIVKEWHLEE